MNRLIVIICFLLHSFAFSAQETFSARFDREMLEEDLLELRKTILESHPDPFVFCTRKEFEDMYLACKMSLDDEMDYKGFSLVVANLLGVLRDSHTAIDYNQLMMLQFGDDGYVMPLSLERIEDEKSDHQFSIIIKSDWGNKIEKGSKLLSINEIPVMKLYERALEYACIEGDAAQARDAVAVAILPVVTGLIKPYTSENTVQIIPLGSEEPVQVVLKGYRSKEYHRNAAQRGNSGQYDPVKFEYDEENNLAILKVGTFAPSSGRNYRKQISQAIESTIASGSNDLVLDIRGNGGGSSAWVEYLYSFIDQAGYNTPSNVIGRNSEIAMNRTKFFHTAIGNFFTFLFFRNNEDVQSFRKFAALEYGKSDTLYFHVAAKQNEERVFTGNCYLLINGLTASAGVDFTNAFKSRKRGLVIGEQCLGPSSGTWGNPAWFTLPNSGLRVSISTIRYNYDNSFEYQLSAIEPDFFVDCVPEDIRKEVDTQIEFVKKLIADKK
jgi:hypothetical protein